MEELEEIIMAVEELDDDLLKIYRIVINYWKNKCQNLESDKEELEYHQKEILKGENRLVCNGLYTNERGENSWTIL